MRSMTICHRILLLIALSQFSLEPVDMTSEIRRKRVLHGLPTEAKDRDQYYPHFRYFVYLAKEVTPGQFDDDPGWLKKWLKIGLTPPIETQYCGGSLLTPLVVQTACHCLAKFTTNVKGNFTYATVLDMFEDRIFSYVGSNIMEELYNFLVPKRYIIHEACRKVTNSESHMYDFAVIVNKESIYERAKGAKISYAPIYSGVDIRSFYYTALKKEYTCLIIGFGRYGILPPDENEACNIDDTPSRVLRWGWRSLRNYKDCMALSSTEQTGKYNYRQASTWTCFSSTIREGYHHSSLPGDSGGPVICNNVYFAVQSYILCHDDATLLDSMADPIVFTPFENSEEYRALFIQYCNELGDKQDLPATHPPHPWKPTPPPAPRPRRSQCSPKVILRPFTILSSTLFTWFSYHYSFPL